MKAIRELINNKAKRNCPIYPEERVFDHYDGSSDEDKSYIDEEMKEEMKEEKLDFESVPNFGLVYRSYTPACKKDDWNIRCGRCPDYAVDWSDEMNQRHWPPGHDFINGYKGTPRRDEFKPEMLTEMNKKLDELYDKLFQEHGLKN